MRRVLVLALILACSVQARASDLQLVGEARLKVLFWPIYDSRLYTADGQYQDGQLPVRLELAYLRDIRARDLIDRTAQEWDQQGLDNPRRAEWLERLEDIWPDVSKDERLALEVDSDGLSRFYHNGELLGLIEDPAFGASFLGIWLAPNTSHPQLRLALIGGD